MKKRAGISIEAVFEKTGLLLVALDQEGHIIHVNTALKKLSGYTNDEAVGKSMWDFAISDDAREADIANLERLKEGKLLDPIEQYLLTRDGRKRLIAWRTTTADAGKGRPVMILAVGMDITERRLAEEALASSEGFFRMLIENALDLVTVLGADGKVVYIGPSVERLLGYGQEEIIGRSLVEFIHPDDTAAARGSLDFAVSRPGVTGYIEIRVRHKDGRWRIHEASSFNLLDDPAVQGIVINSRDITERREAEDKLSLRSREIETIFQALPDLYFRFERDSTILDYEAGRTAYLYVPPEEFMGKKLPDVLPPGIGEIAENFIGEVSENKEPRSFEYTLPFNDGERRYEARMLPVLEDEVIAVIRDITESRAAERLVEVQRDLALKLSGGGELEEVLRVSLAAVFEATGFDSGGIFLLDEGTGGLVLKYHEGVGQTFVDSVSYIGSESPFAKILNSGESIYGRYGELDLQADIKMDEEDLRALAAIPLQSEGRVIGSINVASHRFDEITPQIKGALDLLAGQIGRAIEQAALVNLLAESEEKYRVTFDSTGSAMVILGVDGTILDANQEIGKLLGYSREEVVGRKKYLEFVHPEDREFVKRYSRRLLKGELRGPARYEARTVRRDGRVLNTIIVVSTLPGMDSSVASIMDITDKKTYELELEARAAQLRDFLDIAAHELRHPATLIEGYADTLQKFGVEMSHEDLAGALAGIVKGADKLTGVVNDLLDMSRIERGFMSLERGTHVLEPLARDAVEEMSARGGGRSIAISCMEDHEEAWLDQEKFVRLIVILLDNAVKYSPPGSPVEIHLGQSAKEALVSVLDRGVGIPEGERSRIFDRFYQSEGVLHHSAPGLGLGLYIAKRIVEAHGGRIWCEAREGGGSVFRFTIPMRGDSGTS